MSQNLSRRQLLRAGLAGSATLAAAAVHAAPAGLYKPGTYTAKAAGIASDVRVSMTFEVHLGSPWNAALTFKKKSGRLPPRKKSSAHSKFQADSSY